MCTVNDSQVATGASPAVAPKPQVAVLLVAAIVACLAGAFIIQQTGNVVAMSPEFVDIPLVPSPEYMARYNAAFADYRSRNYAIHFVTIGSLLGLAIGSAGTVTHRLRSLMAAGLGGALAGGVGGYLLGLAAAYSVQINRGEAINLLGVQVEPIVQTTALQCFVWALIGIGIGCGWTVAAWGRERVLRGVEGGVLGGLLAGVAHCIFTSIVFSNSSGFTFIPDKLVEKLFWAALCGSCVCLGLIYSVLRSPKSR